MFSRSLKLSSIAGSLALAGVLLLPGLLGSPAVQPGEGVANGELLDLPDLPVSFDEIAVSGTTVPCGEPTVGVSDENNIFFRCNYSTYRSTNNGTTWTVVRSHLENFDPMLWVDQSNGRVFTDDLLIACSIVSFSDNEGATWQPTSQGHPLGCGTPVNDHQKIVSGPWLSGTPRNPGLYSRAVFRCFNGVAYAGCALSPDGGVTFEPAVPVTTLVGAPSLPTLNAACPGLHGHPYIGGQGYVYLPRHNCGGGNAVGFSISQDEGLTWKTRFITTPSSDGDNDADITTTPNGRVWVAYIARFTQGGVTKSLPYVGYTDNQGVSFTTIQVGLGTYGLNTATFPAITSGDNGRIAVGFLGTTSTGGNSGAEGVGSSAVWNAYVAITYDNGTSWTTSEVTTDPVQRGTICMSGTSCGSDRNLLDFNDMTTNEYGTVIYGFADGCVSSTCTGASGTAANSRAKQGKIALQDSGDTLLSAWDAFF